MYPWITFTLSGSKYTIASYTLFAFIGALTGIFLSLPLLKREGISVHRSIRLLTVMLLFFLAGARILNFIINPKAYGTNLHLYSLKFAGFSVYGGIFGALAALLIWCKIERTDPQPVLDA
ncbi:MAG TPA: prolipoprotein diacylglyceryl transferase, partial [Lachnospiraceae bacterium]|nr:prolipoprotein diacylglyceryl transferase [Lachnospiraceae bacterium]